jgi:hypothetical protein
MSAGDYISLKKTKLLQNYHVNTKTAIAETSYENYVHNLNLKAVKCSTSTFGNGMAKPLSLNNVLVGRTTNCPANSYDGPAIHPIVDTTTPLQSSPSVPSKFQMPAAQAAPLSIPAKYKVVCYKGQHLCMQPTYASTFNAESTSAPYLRQWNLKKPAILSVTDSTTFRM